MLMKDANLTGFSYSSDGWNRQTLGKRFAFTGSDGFWNNL